MKKNIIYLLIGCMILLLPSQMKAGGSSHWEYDSHAYEYDMSMYVALNQRNVKVERWDEIELAAFCNNECRGVAVVEKTFGSNGVSYYYLRVRSNSASGEALSFKCYDQVTNKEINLPESVPFKAQERYGYPSNPFIMNLPFISVSAVTLNKTTLTLKTSETEVLIATVAPEDATDKNLSWHSSNESVATVSTDGKVTAVKSGTAVITVATVDGNFTATCSLTVIQPVTGVSLNKTELTLKTTQTEKLIATVMPADAANKDLSWHSSNESVATVGTDGKVTALQSGTSVITVTTADGNFTATCSLTVIQPVTGVSLNKTELTLKTTQTETLIAIIAPEDATNKNLSWHSSNETVATVGTDGKVTALQSGTAVITVTTADGNFTATCSLTVIQSVTGVSLNKTELTLIVDETETLIATVLPADAANKAFSWRSSQEPIATVGTDGQVTALQPGTSVITATTEDGGFIASCSLTVVRPVTGVSLDQTSLILKVEETMILTALITPEDATNKKVTWDSSDKSIATVGDNGTVSALKVGNAIISVTAEDGHFTADCELEVIPGSNIESLGTDLISIYPTVVDNCFYVNGLSGKELISVFTCQGNMVKTRTCADGSVQIVELGSLPKGTYLVSIQSGDKVMVAKFFKR